VDKAEFDPVDFPPPERKEPAKLYLISPQEVGGTFPDRLKAACETSIAAAFQLRVKDVDFARKEILVRDGKGPRTG